MFSIKNFIQSYHISQSETGLDIPVVNDVPLHCLRDPLEEARHLVLKHEKQLETHPLIFGSWYWFWLSY